MVFLPGPWYVFCDGSLSWLGDRLQQCLCRAAPRAAADHWDAPSQGCQCHFSALAAVELVSRIRYIVVEGTETDNTRAIFTLSVKNLFPRNLGRRSLPEGKEDESVLHQAQELANHLWDRVGEFLQRTLGEGDLAPAEKQQWIQSGLGDRHAVFPGFLPCMGPHWYSDCCFRCLKGRGLVTAMPTPCCRNTNDEHHVSSPGPELHLSKVHCHLFWVGPYFHLAWGQDVSIHWDLHR